MPNGRILCVDDEPSIRISMSVLLESEGYDAVTAEDGLDGLKKLEETSPDLVISDLRMPNMSGFEFLSLVRIRFPHIPLIAISGQFVGGEMPEGLVADVFLQKAGYSIEELFRHIKTLIGQSKSKIGQSKLKNR